MHLESPGTFVGVPYCKAHVLLVPGFVLVTYGAYLCSLLLRQPSSCRRLIPASTSPHPRLLCKHTPPILRSAGTYYNSSPPPIPSHHLHLLLDSYLPPRQPNTTNRQHHLKSDKTQLQPLVLACALQTTLHCHLDVASLFLPRSTSTNCLTPHYLPQTKRASHRAKHSRRKPSPGLTP